MTYHHRAFGLVVASFPLVLAFLVRSAAAFQGVPSATATAAVQVQGKVVLDNNGAAVSGVTVTLVQVSATPRATALNPINSGTVTVTPISGGATGGASSAATTATTTTANDGSFSAAGLATEQFAVCVKDPSAAVIDPCLWTDSRMVSVQVNDTAQALAQKPTDAYTPHVLVGAFDARGGFHPARQTQKTSAGISYQLAIPFDSPIRVTIYSAQVQLATSSNLSLPPQGYSTTFVPPSSETGTNSFTFNAVGRKLTGDAKK